jgi:hypothetical protein
MTLVLGLDRRIERNGFVPEEPDLPHVRAGLETIRRLVHGFNFRLAASGLTCDPTNTSTGGNNCAGTRLCRCVREGGLCKKNGTRSNACGASDGASSLSQQGGKSTAVKNFGHRSDAETLGSNWPGICS